MNLVLHALGMLCALGAATLATAAANKRYAMTAMGLGFLVSLVLLGPDRILDPSLIGLTVAVVAIAQLARPGMEILTSGCAGALAGLWFSLLQIQSVPTVAAFVMAVAVPVASVYMTSRRSAFAPLALGEEAFLWVIALALIVAIGPGFSSGWESATVINLEYETGMEQEMSNWVLVMTVGSIVAGSIYSLVWRRR